MNAVSVEQMRELENSLFSQGIDAATLMEDAGWGIACSMRKFFPLPGRAVLYLGKGHNAGDALCAARHLRRWGWLIELRPAYPEMEWATLTRQQGRALEAVPQVEATGLEETVIIDGLLGIGASGELREPIRAAVMEINARRLAHAIPVVALDIPTGLDADTGKSCEVAVTADYTFFIGAPKLGLLKSTAVNCVGRLEAILLVGLDDKQFDSGLRLITPQSMPQSLPIRAHDYHKGDAGRVSVIAGSVGMEGAALMTATASLRAGAGLVTLWVSAEAYASVTARACPALMVQPYRQWRKISFEKADAVVIGPGLGMMSEEAFQVMVDLLDKNPCPGVLDADAINAIARHRGHNCLQARHVITPHPGEFTRLAPMSALRPREEACSHFTENNSSVLLLKGARTLIQQRGGPLYHNSTGHAGMATAGMGDVLAGVIAGLQAQGMSALSSACAGSWICGRAAEIIVTSRKQSALSLIATDLLDCIGQAASEWQRGE
jgi:NAD(P)H-hydrate epimerase